MPGSLFKRKLQAWSATLLKKDTLGQVFSCEFCEISKKTFSYKTPPVVASDLFQRKFEGFEKLGDILDSKTKYSKIPAQQVEPTLFQQILFVSVSHLNPILPYLFKLLKTSWNLQNQVIVSNVVLYITIVI